MPKAHLFKAERLDRPEDQLAAYEELRISNDFSTLLLGENNSLKGLKGKEEKRFLIPFNVNSIS
jgi:hypothetical protein